MKRVIFVVALLFSGMVSAADQCNAINPCGYTSSMEYVIKDAEGNVVDTTRWEQFQGVNWITAYRMKYATLSHIFSAKAGETEPALSVGLQQVFGD